VVSVWKRRKRQREIKTDQISIGKGFFLAETPGNPKMIGVAGSGHSVGVTHFSVSLAAYLSGVLCRRTALLEWNDSGDFARVEQVCAKKMVTDYGDNSFNISDIFCFKKAGRRQAVSCLESGFDAIVIDFGVFRPGIRDDFFLCGRRFLVGSVSEWQLPGLADFVEKQGARRHRCEYFSAFGDQEALNLTERFLGIQIRKIPISEQAFVVTGDSLVFMEGFLK
jgi:hypothetical protein